jgi:hypothetical protein
VCIGCERPSGIINVDLQTRGHDPILPAPACEHVWARRRDGRVCKDCGAREYGDFYDG